jgi:hypothetical protein
MVDILTRNDVINPVNIEIAAKAKIEKLKKWSNIFTD